MAAAAYGFVYARLAQGLDGQVEAMVRGASFHVSVPHRYRPKNLRALFGSAVPAREHLASAMG